MADQRIILEFVGDAKGLKPAVEALKQVGALGEKQKATFDQMNGSFLKGSEGAKRFQAEVARSPKTISELNLKLSRLRDILVDDTKIGTEGFRKIQREIVKTQEQVNKANSGLKGMGGAATSAGAKFAAMGRQIMVALGFVGVIMAVVNAFKQLVSVNKDFEYQMAKVKAVSGATDKQFQALTANAKMLGATTKYTATQAGELSEEYAKLGFSTEEIINATEATLLLAEATGTDLGEAAQNVGQILRAFGLDASETGRVADVMALSFSKSALNMQAYASAMKYVAPIAKAANIDIETTTALMAKLADSGLRGTMAGTGLKNLMSKLSNANSSLSKELGYSVKNSDDLIRAFKDLKEKNIDLTKATELTDERSKAAFLTLIQGASDVEALARQFDNAGGAAQRMAYVMRDTLQGDTDKMAAAWEALLLAIESTGLARFTVQGLTAAIDGTREAIEYAKAAADDWDKDMEKADKGLFLRNQLLRDATATMIEYGDGTIKAAVAIMKIEELTKSFGVELKKAIDNGEVKFINLDTTRMELSEMIEQLKEGARLDVSVGLNDDDFFTPDQINAKLEKIAKEAADNAKKTPIILNLAYYDEAIKRAKELRAGENTSIADVKKLTSELKDLEEARAILLGKQTDEMKEQEKLLKDVDKAWEEGNKLMQRMQEGMYADQEFGIERRAKILKLQATQEIEDAGWRSHTIQNIEADRLFALIGLRKEYKRDTLDLEQQLADLEAGMNDEQLAAYAKYLKEREKLDDKYKEKQAEMYVQMGMQGIATIASVSASMAKISDNALQAEQNALDERLEQGLITRDRYDKEMEKLNKERAKKQKSDALFAAIISTAQAVIGALAAQPWSYANIGYAALMGIAGAAEIAAIQSAPLPQFAVGTKNAPAGYKWVGEHGRELIYDKGGDAIITHAESNVITNDPYSKRAKEIRAKYDIPQLHTGLFKPSMQLSDEAYNAASANAGRSDDLAQRIATNIMFQDKGIITQLKDNQRSDRYGYRMLAKVLDKRVNDRTGW